MNSPTRHVTCQEQNADYRSEQEDYVVVSDVPAMDAEQARAFLENSLQRMEEKTNYKKSGQQNAGDEVSNFQFASYFTGSTFTGAVVTRDNKVVTAHLGDSPAALIIVDPKTGEVETKLLTEPHTPSQELKEFKSTPVPGKEPYEWIELNGRVILSDMDVILAVNRALGDLQFGEAVSKEPAIHEYDLDEYHKAGKKVFLLVASDGVASERQDITLEQHAQAMADMLRSNPDTGLDAMAKRITKDAEMPRRMIGDLATGKLVWDKAYGTRDNITVTLAEIPPDPEKSTVMAVFDGHGAPGHEIQAAGVPVEEQVAALAQQEFKRCVELENYRQGTLKRDIPDSGRGGRG